MKSTYQNKIESFYQDNKRMPSYSEMMKLFGLKSKNAIAKIVDKLSDAGFVAKDHLGRMVPSQSFGEIPMLGLIKAGFPSEAEEQVLNTVNLDDFLIQKKELTYMLEVDGDSMIDAHIQKGDTVLVEQKNTAKDGEIVIAEIDGEYTMKYFKKSGEKTWLEPANENFSPMHPTTSLNVIAVLKAVIRKY